MRMRRILCASGSMLALAAAAARLSPDSSTLSVTGGRGQVLSTFTVNGGDITELTGSPVPLPADSSPTGLVVL